MSLFSTKTLAKATTKTSEISLALGSGVLMGITFAPLEMWYLAWIALAPLWYLLYRESPQPRSRSRSFDKLLYPLCWGIGCYGVGLSWIFGIHPMTWMGVPEDTSFRIAVFCLTFITLWGASLVVLWSIATQFIESKTKLNPWTRIIFATACWCGVESLYSLSDLWWPSLALTQSPHNLSILHLGQLSGPNTVSGSIVLINGLIAEAYLAFERYRHAKPKERIRQAAPYFNGAIGTIIILHLIGWTLANRPLIEPIESALKIGIIQGNIGNEIKLYRSGHEIAIENYTQGYLSLAEQHVDAIVTPETALPFTESQIKRTLFYQAILDKKIPAFVGGFGESNRGFTNSLMTISGEGKVLSHYDKWKLVPLGEYIPFGEYLSPFISRLSPLKSQLVAGKFAPSTMTPFGNAIFGICYDSAYAEHFRRQAQNGNLIITASNDAHYSAAMPAQHHAQDVMRAIETDRWAVRASNTGYSAIVNPHGHTEWISELNQFTTHAHQVYRQSTQTPYVRFGDWLTPLLLAVGGILFFSPKMRARKL
jgi:apolipoprotein N-acyltransferase